MITSEEDIEFIKSFGLNLRRIRKSKRLSMEKLAEFSELDYSQISKIERGLTNTTIRTLNKISKALGVPVKDLFDFEL